MHDKIKELMGQTLDEKFAGTWSVMDLQDLTKFADKFAELIVRECMELTKQCSTGKGIHDLFADEIIAEHFGVEE
jgi:hypothetical protein